MTARTPAPFRDLSFWTASVLLVLGPPLLLPNTILPLSWHPALLGTMIGLIALYIWQTHTGRFPEHPVQLPILLLVVWLPFNLRIAVSPEAAWSAMGYLLYGIALFSFLVHWPPARRSPVIVAGLLMLSGAGLAVVATFLTDWKSEFRLFSLPVYERLVELRPFHQELIHANVMAGALIVIIPLGLAMSLDNSRDSRSRWLLGFITALMLIITMLTQSRGGYLGVAAGMVTVLALRYRKLLWSLPFVFITLAGLAWLEPAQLLDALSRDGSLGGWDGRMTIWRASVMTFNEMPLTGIGLGSFTQIIPVLHRLPFPIDNYPHAHNLGLHIGLEHGLFGLISLLALQINLVAMLVAGLRFNSRLPEADGENAKSRQLGLRPNFSEHRALTVGSAGSLVALHVHGLLDVVTWSVKLAFIPWLLYALIVLLFLQAHAWRSSLHGPT